MTDIEFYRVEEDNQLNLIRAATNLLGWMSADDVASQLVEESANGTITALFEPLT